MPSDDRLRSELEQLRRDRDTALAAAYDSAERRDEALAALRAHLNAWDDNSGSDGEWSARVEQSRLAMRDVLARLSGQETDDDGHISREMMGRFHRGRVINDRATRARNLMLMGDKDGARAVWTEEGGE